MNPLRQLVQWLSAHTQFPARRLDTRAELMLCAAALTAAEEAAGEASATTRHLIKSRDPAQTSAQRAHAMRRSQVHFKCDNSAKV